MLQVWHGGLCDDASENGAPEGHNFLEYLVAGFADHHFFTGDESDDGIRRRLNEFDQVGIYEERLAVQSGQLNHGGWNLCRQSATVQTSALRFELVIGRFGEQLNAMPIKRHG